MSLGRKIVDGSALYVLKPLTDDISSVKERILNVGCGNDTYGTDFVDIYPSRNEVIKCDVDKKTLPFKNKVFDEVYCDNLFEHLTNLGFVMSEIHRVLKKGGKLILITDNANYLPHAYKGTHLGGYEKETEETTGKVKDRHYELFTDWHLRNYAMKFGFKNIKTTYVARKYSRITFRVILTKTFEILRITKIPVVRRLTYNQIKLEATK